MQHSGHRFDEIVVGSGLSALAVVLGLPACRRVLVIGGPEAGQFTFYDGARTVPCGLLRHGGLGTYWHGVIPTGCRPIFGGASDANFETLIRHFYPNIEIGRRLRKPWLFVPWRPIRPKAAWLRLQAERGKRLEVRHELLSSFTQNGRGVSGRTGSSTYHGTRIWVCAGALASPALLDRSLETTVSRQFVSDHVTCYMGQIDRSRARMPPPRPERSREGVWFESQYNDEGKALYTVCPARFSFSRLDHSAVQRSAGRFPTAGLIHRLMKEASLGLVAEVLYNRTGLFPGARMQSVYAQINVTDAYQLDGDPIRISARRGVIQASIDEVRANPMCAQMRMSRRPEIFIPGIHLHGSVDVNALTRAGANGSASCVQVVDASTLRDIGPEHHSFKLMVAAFHRARALTQSA